MGQDRSTTRRVVARLSASALILGSATVATAEPAPSSPPPLLPLPFLTDSPALNRSHHCAIPAPTTRPQPVAGPPPSFATLAVPVAQAADDAARPLDHPTTSAGALALMVAWIAARRSTSGRPE